MKQLTLLLILLIGATSFSQNYMPSCQTWFRANENVYTWFGLTAFNNSSVLSWSDNSMNHWDAEGLFSLTSNPNPIYLSSAATDVNYNPCIEFDGVNDKLDLGDNYPFSQNNGITYFVVVEPEQSNKPEAFVFDFGSYANKGYGLTHSSGTSIHYSSTAAGNGGAVSGLNHNFGTEAVIIKYEIEFGVEQRLFYQGEFLASDAAPISLPNLNSQAIAVQNANAASKGPFTIGRQSKNSGLSNNNIRAFQGKIMEVIGIEKILSATESRAIESYLALKYAITLDNTGYNTGLPLLNYIASDGTNLYSVYDANYYNDVIGIGVDENMSIYQKQSHTANDDFRIYIGQLAANNSSNGASFTPNSNPSNIQYIVSGNNQAATYATTNSMMEKPSSINSRVEREWKIENTNFAGSFSMDLELANYAINSGVTLSDLRLLIDDDGDFTNAQSYSTASGISFALNGNMLTIANIHDSILPTNSTKFITVGSIGVGTPLAVSLNYFETTYNANQQHIQLDWETLTEVNNDHFIIEKSTDSENWELIAKIPSAGNNFNPQYYSYTDDNSAPGIYYYRLSQSSLDGERTPLEISSVDVIQNEETVELYPNPAKNFISITSPDIQNKQISLLNAQGINEKNISFQPKNNHTLLLDISALQKGMYFVVINGESYKFIKR